MAFTSSHPIPSHPKVRVCVIVEALIELTEDESIWQGDGQDERLRQAYVQFVAECRRHGVSHLAAKAAD